MKYKEKRNKSNKEEEEINSDKVGILKFMFGVEEFLIGAGRKTHFPNLEIIYITRCTYGLFLLIVLS